MSTEGKCYLSPAKINLFLHILNRRADGYHELQTVFQLLDFGDELTFNGNENGILTLHQTAENQLQPLPASQNIIIKAAQLLRKRTNNVEKGAEIILKKRIPIGGGLGGGSSNAATTLKVLNRLWRCNLSDKELSACALQLGADVPFFLGGHSAWGEGVGEKLRPIQLEKAWYVVITPKCSVSTALIFSQENSTRNTQAIKMADFLAGSARVRNDCELITKKLYPKIEEAHSWLSKHAETRMTGTGASVFAKFTSEKQARAVLEQAPKGMRGFVAEGVNSL